MRRRQRHDLDARLGGQGPSLAGIQSVDQGRSPAHGCPDSRSERRNRLRKRRKWWRSKAARTRPSAVAPESLWSLLQRRRTRSLMAVATEVSCDCSRLISDSHAEPSQVVAAALAFAFGGLPTKADMLDGGAGERVSLPWRRASSFARHAPRVGNRPLERKHRACDEAARRASPRSSRLTRRRHPGNITSGGRPDAHALRCVPAAMVAQRLASSGRGAAMTRCTLIFTPSLPRNGPSNLRSQRRRALGVRTTRSSFNRHVLALWIARRREGTDVFGTFGGRRAEYRLGHYGCVLGDVNDRPAFRLQFAFQMFEASRHRAIRPASRFTASESSASTRPHQQENCGDVFYANVAND